MPHKNYLRLNRKKWALSQRQLARLVGLKARSVISSHELGECVPGLRFAIAYLFIFGVPLDALFPALCKEVEDAVMRRAAVLDQACRDRNDATSARIRELLQEMIGRASHHDAP